MPATRRSLPDPVTLVAFMAAAQVVLWTLAPALTHSAPPLDVVESTMWGREWVLATYKHPALPSWVLELGRLVTGSVGWPAYLASQLCIAATFACVFLLGRDLMGPARAAAGTLLLAGIAYYAWPTPEFNHNIAETPFWAALALALWRAVERRSLAWWALLGVLAAGGLYAKFAMVLLLATAGAWLLLDSRARQSLATPGPWLALGICVALTLPLAQWLIVHDFLPLQYAAERAAMRAEGGLHIFLLNLLLNLAGMLAMLAVAGLIGPLHATTAPTDPSPPVGERERRFLLAFTAGPLALAILGAVLGGTGLKAAWGSSMFNLIGLLAIAYTSHRFSTEALRRVAVFAAVLLVVVPLGYALVIAIGPRVSTMATRVQWPQAEIAERLGKVWARETGGRPLRIVSGDSWVAGLVGIAAKDKPSMFSNGDFRLSPWITSERLQREGALVVWNTSRPLLPDTLKPLVDPARSGEERFKWPGGSRRPDIVIGYAVIAPK